MYASQLKSVKKGELKDVKHCTHSKKKTSWESATAVWRQDRSEQDVVLPAQCMALDYPFIDEQEFGKALKSITLMLQKKVRDYQKSLPSGDFDPKINIGSTATITGFWRDSLGEVRPFSVSVGDSPALKVSADGKAKRVTQEKDKDFEEFYVVPKTTAITLAGTSESQWSDMKTDEAVNIFSKYQKNPRKPEYIQEQVCPAGKRTSGYKEMEGALSHMHSDDRVVRVKRTSGNKEMKGALSHMHSDDRVVRVNWHSTVATMKPGEAAITGIAGLNVVTSLGDRNFFGEKMSSPHRRGDVYIGEVIEAKNGRVSMVAATDGFEQEVAIEESWANIAKDTPYSSPKDVLGSMVKNPKYCQQGDDMAGSWCTNEDLRGDGPAVVVNAVFDGHHKVEGKFTVFSDKQNTNRGFGKFIFDEFNKTVELALSNPQAAAKLLIDETMKDLFSLLPQNQYASSSISKKDCAEIFCALDLIAEYLSQLSPEDAQQVKQKLQNMQLSQIRVVIDSDKKSFIGAANKLGFPEHKLVVLGLHKELSTQVTQALGALKGSASESKAGHATQQLLVAYKAEQANQLPKEVANQIMASLSRLDLAGFKRYRGQTCFNKGQQAILTQLYIKQQKQTYAVEVTQEAKAKRRLNDLSSKKKSAGRKMGLSVGLGVALIGAVVAPALIITAQPAISNPTLAKLLANPAIFLPILGIVAALILGGICFVKAKGYHSQRKAFDDQINPGGLQNKISPEMCGNQFKTREQLKGSYERAQRELGHERQADNKDKSMNGPMPSSTLNRMGGSKADGVKSEGGSNCGVHDRDDEGENPSRLRRK